MINRRNNAPCLLLAVGMALSVAATASAQSNKEDRQRPRVDLSGTITKSRGGLVEVAAESVRIRGQKEEPGEKTEPKASPKKPETYVVAIHPKNTTVRISGTATAKYLRPRQYVRFEGQVDAKNAIEGSVLDVEVFVPEADFKPAFTVRFPAPKFASDVPPPKSRSFSAQGQVVGYSRGQLRVAVNGETITAPVPEDAIVRFTMNNLSVVKPGDKITVAGRLYRAGAVIGESVSISLAPRDKTPTEPEALFDD